jgi:AcrR family transcriptional regulator
MEVNSRPSMTDPSMSTPLPASPSPKEASRQQRGVTTSDGILRAALRLMAENGYNGVSLRRICIEAGVNLALMNYHFGTKAELLLAIFRRWGAGVAEERLRLLTELQRSHPAGDPPLEDLLHAFIIPALSLSRTDREDELHFLRLSGRLATDPTPEVRRVIAQIHDEAALKFVRSLRQVCSHLSSEEFFMRLIFLYGAMVYTRAEAGRVDSLADKMGVELPRTLVHDAGKYLIPFLAAALRAPPTVTSESKP